MSRRADIIKCATALFHRKGFELTSLEEVAVAVGIRREGIYHYFKDKSRVGRDYGFFTKTCISH